MAYTGKKPVDHTDVTQSQSMAVTDDLTVDTSTLKVDSANNRVGVGVAAPDAKLHVLDTAASTATHSYTKLHIEDSDHLALQFSGGTGGEQWIWFADDSTSTPVGGITYYHGGPYMAFRVEGGERMRINSSGFVGISATDPKFHLQTENGGVDSRGSGAGIAIRNNLYYSSGDKYLTASGAASTQYFDGSGNIIFYNTGTASSGAGNAVSLSEVMRIDSSGNVLVGTTSNAPTTTAGINLGANNKLHATRSGGTSGYFNRLSSDGGIVEFAKDGSTVGQIGVYTGLVYFGQGDTNLMATDAGNQLLPRGTNGANRDNAIDLGSSSNRFDDIFATNGTIQTSDRNEKQDIEALSEAEQRVAVAAKGLLRKFRWKDSVEEKGDDARIHFGIIAQDLQAAFEAEGLDAGRYAMFINSTWTDEKTGEERSRMGVRYNQLLAFIIAAI